MVRSWRLGLAAGALAVAATGVIVSTPAMALADPAAPSHGDSATAPQFDWGANALGFEVTVQNESSQTLGNLSGNQRAGSPQILPEGHGDVTGKAAVGVGGGPGSLDFKYVTAAGDGSCEIQLNTRNGQPGSTMRRGTGNLSCDFSPGHGPDNPGFWSQRMYVTVTNT